MHTPLVQQPENFRRQQLADAAVPKRAWSLKVHLLVFGLMLVLPILALAGFLIVKINDSNRAELEQRMIQVASGLAAEIDREIQRSVAILQTLATSPALERGDFATFHAYASAVLQEDKAGIFLIDAASFQQLLNTYVPFGTELPKYGSPETAQRVLETKRWRVSNFFIGRISKKPALDIALPIFRNGATQYILVMGLEPVMFQRIVHARKLPADWMINIADRVGTIIVRSTDQNKYVGTKLSNDLIAQRTGTVTRVVNLEGVAVLRATATSDLSGWQVASNLPAAAAEEPVRQVLFYLGIWSAAILLLIALIASWFSRTMARPIVLAANAAANLAHRRAIAVAESRVSEANQLIDAIRSAAQDLSSADETRRTAEENQRLAYRQLEQERTQTAALLRQRNAIFSAMPNGVLVVDHDGRIQLLNERLTREFGYRDDELLGQRIEMLVPERFRGHHADLRRAYAADPSPRHMGAGRDLFGLRKDGSEFPIEIGLNPLTVDGREMVLAIVINIAERKRAEKIAAESAARQAALYELSDRLHRANTKSAIYNAALDTMEAALHCDRASILLRDDARVMRFVSWRGLSDDYRRAVDSHSPWTGDEPDPQPIYIPDIAAANFDEGLKSVVSREGIRALAFIPLVSTGKLLGKFMTYYNEPHAFSEDERGISLTIARQLALSIEQKRADDSLRRSEHRLELALNAGQMGAWEWDIRTNRVFWSPSLEQIHGLEPGTFGGTFDDFASDIHPDDKARVIARIQDAISQRQDHHDVYRMKRPDGAVRWLEAFGRLTLGADGTPESMAGVCIDITERKRAEETEKLLSAELQHRTKNLFAVIQALAMRTLRGDPTLEDAREAFVGRLEALARSDTRLSNSSWNGASLLDVVKSELAHFSDRIKVVDGPDVVLAPQAAQNFALAIHELSTNAAKYGSLSKPGGEIIIGWAVANNGEALQFRWQERGGPTVAPPNRKGFGTSLIESTLGKGRVEYRADGLIYEVELPLADVSPRGASGGQFSGLSSRDR